LKVESNFKLHKSNILKVVMNRLTFGQAIANDIQASSRCCLS